MIPVIPIDISEQELRRLDLILTTDASSLPHPTMNNPVIETSGRQIVRNVMYMINTRESVRDSQENCQQFFNTFQHSCRAQFQLFLLLVNIFRNKEKDSQTANVPFTAQITSPCK